MQVKLKTNIKTIPKHDTFVTSYMLKVSRFGMASMLVLSFTFC